MADLVVHGRPDSRQYRLGYFKKARKEALKAMTAVQYAYVVRMFERLRQWGNHEEMEQLRIEQIDEFLELKLKGNVLGNMNLRVFFGVEDERRVVVALGVYVKGEEDETPRHIVLAMRNRNRSMKAQFSMARKEK